jgi:hypothetical protein
MVHGVRPNLGRLPARSINDDGEPAPLVDADVGSLQQFTEERTRRKGTMNPLRQGPYLEGVEFSECERGCSI